MDIFSKISTRVDLDFHNTRGVLYPNAQPKRVGIWAWHVFVEAGAWIVVSTTHTDLSFHGTPKPGLPRVRLIACVCVHALILITGVYGCLLRGLSPAPQSSKI